MGGRKFRLAVHRKNEERKQRQKKHEGIVVENKDEDTTTSNTCPISLPLTAFISGHVQSLAELSSRVKAVVSKYDTCMF